MRPHFALAAMALLTAAVVPAAGAPQRTARVAARDWSAAVAPTPQGGLLIGNPAAATKIVEYGSYTCSHCAHFAAESKAGLDPLLRSGRASFEYRALIRDPIDLAAVLTVRCGGLRRFRALHEAVFAGQGTWLPRGAEFAQTNRATLAAAEPGAQLRGLAEGAGLLAIGRAHGVTDVQLGRCFADKAGIDRAVASARTVPAEVTGTPSFFVNGRFTGAHDWAGLRPLVAAR